MMYPKMPELLDRRKKLTKQEKLDIRREYKHLKGLKYLASKYGVCTTTIWLIVNPRKYEICLARRRRQLALRRKNDPLYVEYERVRNSECRKYKRSVQPELKKYYGEKMRGHRYYKKANKIRWDRIKKNTELLKKQYDKNKKWRDMNREHVREMQRYNYEKRKLILK